MARAKAMSSTAEDEVQQMPTLNAVSVPSGKTTMKPSLSDSSANPENERCSVEFIRMPCQSRISGTGACPV
ncbi:hypothetical protein D3C83_73290 [compost metagenome]